MNPLKPSETFLPAARVEIDKFWLRIPFASTPVAITDIFQKRVADQHPEYTDTYWTHIRNKSYKRLFFEAIPLVNLIVVIYDVVIRLKEKIYKVDKTLASYETRLKACGTDTQQLKIVLQAACCDLTQPEFSRLFETLQLRLLNCNSRDFTIFWPNREPISAEFIQVLRELLTINPDIFHGLAAFQSDTLKDENLSIAKVLLDKMKSISEYGSEIQKLLHKYHTHVTGQQHTHRTIPNASNEEIKTYLRQHPSRSGFDALWIDLLAMPFSGQTKIEFHFATQILKEDLLADRNFQHRSLKKFIAAWKEKEITQRNIQTVIQTVIEHSNDILKVDGPYLRELYEILESVMTEDMKKDAAFLDACEHLALREKWDNPPSEMNTNPPLEDPEVVYKRVINDPFCLDIPSELHADPDFMKRLCQGLGIGKFIYFLRRSPLFYDEKFMVEMITAIPSIYWYNDGGYVFHTKENFEAVLKVTQKMGLNQFLYKAEGERDLKIIRWYGHVPHGDQTYQVQADQLSERILKQFSCL